MISIVTGTLNRKKYLPGLIENTVGNSELIELVIVDGGSNDGTIEYIKMLNNDRIKLIEVGHRSSYPNFMNIGIRAATFDWIAQWNDDVILLDTWDMVIKELEENYDLYIFKWTRRAADCIYKDKVDDKWIQYGHCMNFGIYNKRVFRSIGLYDNKFSFYHCDQDMTRRALSFGMTCKCSKIRVCEIMAEKTRTGIWMNILTKIDEKKVKKNMKLYKKRKLPKTIEFLEEKV